MKSAVQVLTKSMASVFKYFDTENSYSLCVVSVGQRHSSYKTNTRSCTQSKRAKLQLRLYNFQSPQTEGKGRGYRKLRSQRSTGPWPLRRFQNRRDAGDGRQSAGIRKLRTKGYKWSLTLYFKYYYYVDISVTRYPIFGLQLIARAVL